MLEAAESRYKSNDLFVIPVQYKMFHFLFHARFGIWLLYFLSGVLLHLGIE